jgi:CRP-like cAMP-binding protein
MTAYLVRHPEANSALLETYVAGIRHLLSLLHDLAFLSVPRRLARVLLEYAESDGGGGLCLPQYLNQLELAFLVGTTRESVNQTLKRFIREGWIAVRQRTVILTDADALRRSTSA